MNGNNSPRVEISFSRPPWISWRGVKGGKAWEGNDGDKDRDKSDELEYGDDTGGDDVSLASNEGRGKDNWMGKDPDEGLDRVLIMGDIMLSADTFSLQESADTFSLQYTSVQVKNIASSMLFCIVTYILLL